MIFGLSHCQLTLKIVLFSLQTSAALCGYTWITLNGFEHRNFSFLGKSCNKKFNKRTESPSWISFFIMYFSCHFFILSFYIMEFSYASKRYSYSSLSCSNIFCLAFLASKFKNLVAQYALCSNSISRWHDFPYMSLYVMFQLCFIHDVIGPKCIV